MPWHERDYYRESAFRGGGGAFGRLSALSVVTWLLVINVVVFLLSGLLASGFRTRISLTGWGYYSVESVFGEGQVWRLITYQFLHGGIFHLLFNMIGLYFFGPLMEQWWGSRRFLAFYLLCGISGALVMTILSFIPGLLMVGPASGLIGASGAIFGILIGAAVQFPHQRVMLLIPPIPMSMRTLAIALMAIVTLSLLVGANAGGNAAHLGGAFLGFLLVKQPHWLDWADRLRGGSSRLNPRRLSPRNLKQKHRRSRFEQSQRRQREEEQTVDRILDKVRQQGVQSLTRGEKKTLSRATRRHQERQ